MKKTDEISSPRVFFSFQIIYFDNKMLAASCRCVSLSALSRANALAITRQSSSQSNKDKDEPAAVSVGDSTSSPMSQRQLPPDDGKVRMYSID